MVDAKILKKMTSIRAAVLTYNEFNNLLPDHVQTNEQIDEWLTALKEKGYQLVDQLPAPTKEFRISIKVNNNLLRARREALGMRSRAVADAAGIGYQTYRKLETMKDSPLSKKGTWRGPAKKLAAFWSVIPEVLWPDAVLAVQQSEDSREYGHAEISQLLSSWSTNQLASPHDHVVQKELAERCDEVLSELPPKLQAVLRKRFYEGKTLEEVGEDMGCSRGYVAQLEARAMRTMRRPWGTRRLKAFIID